MLAIGVLKEIRRLLSEEGFSQRRVAGILGISRGTVAAVASGQHVVARLADSLDSEDEESPVRCPGCGGRVYMPCGLCRARAYEANRRSAGSVVVCDSSPRRRHLAQSSRFCSAGTELTKPAETAETAPSD